MRPEFIMIMLIDVRDVIELAKIEKYDSRPLFFVFIGLKMEGHPSLKL